MGGEQIQVSWPAYRKLPSASTRKPQRQRIACKHFVCPATGRTLYVYSSLSLAALFHSGSRFQRWREMMRILSFMLVLLLSGIAPASAQSSDTAHWLIKASSSNGRITALSYVDANAVTGASGAIRSAWIETYYSDAEIQRTGIQRARSLREFDCSGRRHRTLRSTTYPRDPTQSSTSVSAATEWSTEQLWIEWEFFCGNRYTNQFMRVLIAPEENARRMFFLNYAGVIVTRN